MACVQGHWMWTRCVVSQAIMDSFLPRNDEQILMLELLAVPLAYETFMEKVRGRYVTVFIDNDAVLGALLHGSAGADDANMAIGQIWLDFAAAQIGFAGARVESRANLADGPSRDYLDKVHELQAAELAPCLPSWVDKLWGFPMATG